MIKLTDPLVVLVNATTSLSLDVAIECALVSGAKQAYFRTAVHTVVGARAFEVENVFATTRTILGVFEKVMV
ncbi:MAG: hypothetical protein ACI84O_001553 [Myxococcota bacterium]|jgi:hypothetical protein